MVVITPYQLDRSIVNVLISRAYRNIRWIYWFVASGSTAMFYRRSFLLLKDAIAIPRSNIKRRFNTRIIAINLSNRNILYTLFVSSIVHHITAIFTNNIENIALIYRSIS